ncbi:unnamed protein product [Dicrocoelium dendriticum]|nr:unnamed protein product [Dicrocoelium dendriticum]
MDLTITDADASAAIRDSTHGPTRRASVEFPPQPITNSLKRPDPSKFALNVVIPPFDLPTVSDTNCAVPVSTSRDPFIGKSAASATHWHRAIGGHPGMWSTDNIL